MGMEGYSGGAEWPTNCRLNADSARHARYTSYDGSNVSIHSVVVSLL
jgi:hypothetical protein